MPYRRPRVCGVYSITHIASGRRYIGSSNDIYCRWNHHRGRLRKGIHHSRHLQRAWDKHGNDAFRLEVLEECLNEPTILVAREQVWIDRHRRKLFNGRKAAEIHWGAMSPEHREILRTRMLGNKNGQGKHYHGRLETEDVRKILIDYANGAEMDVLAIEHGVSYETVLRIVKRQIWWTVEIPPEIEAAIASRPRTRGGRGRRNPKAKLYDRIPEIRERLAKGESLTSIASDAGVTIAAIRMIKLGKTYAYT